MYKARKTSVINRAFALAYKSIVFCLLCVLICIRPVHFWYIDDDIDDDIRDVKRLDDVITRVQIPKIRTAKINCANIKR